MSGVIRLCSVVVLLALAVGAAAQPPTVNRWSQFGGDTAIPPVQGNFNQGTPLTLTWGFMAPGTLITDTQYPNGNNNLQTRLNAVYGNQATWQPLFQGVFDRWSALSGMSYQFEANDDGQTVNGFIVEGQLGVRPDIRIGGKPIDGTGPGVLAYNYGPNHGDMVIDTNDNTATNPAAGAINLRNIVSHEHGHGLGMPHVRSNNAQFLMEPFLETAFDGPQYHDILVAHRMYGDVREKSNAGLGNDTAGRANPLGGLTRGGPARAVGTSARTLVVAPTAVDFVSLDSQTDTDFYSFSVSEALRVTILLESLGFNYNITPQTVNGQPGPGDVPFDTRLRNDLRLALIGPDGTTVLQTADATGLGGNEMIVFDLPSGGTYFVRVTGVDNIDSLFLDTQFYALTLTPVPEPASVLLVAAVAAGGWAGRRRYLAKS